MLVKLNLSRAASKMRPQESEQRRAPRPTRKPAAPNPLHQTSPAEPAPLPVAAQPEPVVVPPPPEASAPAAAPKKAWPVKSKRPRFIRVQAEKHERATAAPLPPPSTKLNARLMTKNLALPPKTDATTPLR
jgi:hypothetical protein